jgi:hypothetical protein
MVAHISRFAREIGALEGEVGHDELVATQFAALWEGVRFGVAMSEARSGRVKTDGLLEDHEAVVAAVR